MSVTEQVIWEERPVVRDVLLNPFWWVVIIPLLGLPLLVIWLQRYFTRYTLTSERLIIKRGILARNIDDIELYRVRDTKADQGLWSRILGIGTIEVTSSDRSGFLLIDHITNPHEKREQIRRFSEEAKRGRVRVIEE